MKMLKVSATLYLAATTLHAANPSAPAMFNVTRTIQQTNPSAFTATIGSVPGKTLCAGGFEPMVFRTKDRDGF